jgi:hypothetical protein
MTARDSVDEDPEIGMIMNSQAGHHIATGITTKIRLQVDVMMRTAGNVVKARDTLRTVHLKVSMTLNQDGTVINSVNLTGTGLNVTEAEVLPDGDSRIRNGAVK